MSKKLSFVFDKKSGDLLAPSFVPNHVVSIRSYSSMSENKDLIFVKYPDDFLLVTVCCDYVDGIFGIDGKPEVTEFSDIVGDKNGK